MVALISSNARALAYLSGIDLASSKLPAKKLIKLFENLDYFIQIQVAEEIKDINPKAAKSPDLNLLGRLRLQLFARKIAGKEHGIDFEKLANQAKITDQTEREVLRTFTLQGIQSFKARCLIEAKTPNTHPELIRLCVLDIGLQKNIPEMSRFLKPIIAANPENPEIKAALEIKAEAGDPYAAFVLAHRMVNPVRALSIAEKLKLVEFQKIYESDDKVARAERPLGPNEHSSQDSNLRSLLGEKTDYRSTFQAVRSITKQSFKKEITRVPNEALAINLIDLLKPSDDAQKLREQLADYARQLISLEKKGPDAYSYLSYISKILKKSRQEPELVAEIELKSQNLNRGLDDQLTAFTKHKNPNPNNVLISAPVKLSDDTELQIVSRPAPDSTKAETILVLSYKDEETGEYKLIELDATFTKSMQERQLAGWDPASGPCQLDYQKAIILLAKMETDDRGKSLVTGANQLKAIEVIKLIGYSRSPHNLISSRVFDNPNGSAVTGFMKKYLHGQDSVELYALTERLCEEGADARLIQSLLYQLEINSRRFPTNTEAKHYIEDKAKAEKWLQEGEKKVPKGRNAAAGMLAAISDDERIRIFHLMGLVANTLSSYPNRKDLDYHELSNEEFDTLMTAESNHLDLRRRLIASQGPISEAMREQIDFRDYEFKRAHGLAREIDS